MASANVVLPRPYSIENLLTVEQMRISGASIAASSVSGWGAASGCYLSRSTEEMKWTPAALRVQVAASGTAFFVSENPIPVTAGTTYRSFCWVKTRALRRDVTFGIEWFDAAGNSAWPTVGSSSTLVQGTISGNNGWTLLSVIGDAPGADPANENGFEASTARVRVELPDAGALAGYGPAASGTWYDHQVLWFDDFVLTQYEVPDSGFTRLIQRNIPEYMRLLDAEQESPSYPLLRFADLISATANKILNATIAFDYIPASDGVVGFDRSTLVDTRFYPTADIAEERWLQWLAFVTATRPYVSTILGGIATPWFYLEDSYASWDAIEASYSNPATWDDLAEANPSPLASATLIKEAIRSKGTGILAGTVEGIRRAARLVLTNGQSFDSPVSITCANEVITATFDGAVSAVVGDYIEAYDSSISLLDGQGSTIASVSTTGGNTVITWNGEAGIEDISTPISAYATNRQCVVTPGTAPNIWDVLIETATSQTPDPDVVLAVAEKAKPAGCVLTHAYL